MDYKFGIIIRKNERNIGVCSCGQHNISDNRSYYHYNFTCENCKNDYFIKKVYKEGRHCIPYLELHRKDNRGFKVRRVNLSINYEHGHLRVLKENISRTMEYDIVDKVLNVWRNDELEYKANSADDLDDGKRVNSLFFTLLSEDDFLEFVSTQENRDVYLSMIQTIGKTGFRNKPNVIYGLKVFMNEYQSFQILSNAGIPNVSRFYNRYYTKKTMNLGKTKPHEILNVPKFFIKYIREDVSVTVYTINLFQSIFKKIDHNLIREMLEIVKDEGSLEVFARCIDIIIQLHVDYGYNNLKRLILYLFRETKLTQGINSAIESGTYLRDYVKMSHELDVEYEKYPKSLKKVHDIVTMNYNVIMKDVNEVDKFKKAVEVPSYKELEYKNKKEKYVIVAPNEPNDLVREGNELSHCVASYVKDVIAQKCKIFFLREKEDIDSPVATIEVRGYNIRQARGYRNRMVDSEQKKFIKQWAEDNGLVEAYY